MFSALANPRRFMAFSRWAAPILGLGALIVIPWGVWSGLAAPPDGQHNESIKIFFIHVPTAIISMGAYAGLAGASFVSMVFRHALADAAAKAIAPIGAAMTAMALASGWLWGMTAWMAPGTFVWQVWLDPRVLSMVVLLLFFLGYMALRASIEDEAKAARAGEILALVGVVNLFIVKFSVDCFSTLHQKETFSASGGKCPIPGLTPADDFMRASDQPASGPLLSPTYEHAFLLVFLGFALAFAAIWLARIRAEVWRRRASALALRAALS